MFSPRIRSKSLAIVCRSLAMMLSSGIPIGKAFDLAGKKISDPRCRRALGEVVTDIRQGQDVSSAMRAQGHAFPDSMIDLVSVGEHTGALPEILSSLAEHFENGIRLRRMFFSAIAWPAFQFIAATFVIAAMLLILGWLRDARGGEPIDVLGFGLYGERGAVIWLTSIYGSLGAMILTAMILRRSLLGQKIFDGFLLRIPVIGGCLRSFAIARFSWSFAMTQQAGMSIEPSIFTSFQATSNGAFIAAAPRVWSMLREGETLHDSFAATNLFPVDFLNIVDVAETSGTVPEQLDRLSPEFEAQARRSMQTLASVAAWGIWCLVATFIVFIVFRIMFFYLGILNGALKGV